MTERIDDLLIVGGGPAGVAAALRGRELDLAVRILEADDLMRRIRDYSKEKLILPGFGGGDRMTFPSGGDWIERLAFEPIDKDELCERWTGLCRSCEVPFETGVEFLGMDDDPDSDDAYRVAAYDHRQRREVEYRCRHLALALGRGVPRRFDIPGPTNGISTGLVQADDHVGRPSCVIGGGTSAAEAVIAISHSKSGAGDPSAVHWSYRGDKLPRVSKALAESFFEAYAGNGNIRYHPRSEPLMVTTGDDRRQYLAIRVDRRLMAGRATETSLLEFPVEDCVACIGEDLPEALLASLGIPMVTGGPRNRKRMVVNRWLESVRARVYLIGDCLSQAYFETDDFAADPAGFREVRHRGNIKSATRDGVLVAQVVRQRLDGVQDAELEVEVGGHGDGQSAGSDPGASAPAGATDLDAPTTRLYMTSGPTSPGGTSDAPLGAWLIRQLPGDAETEEFPLAPGSVTSVGRSDCDLSFPDDELLSQRDASIVLGPSEAILRDDGSSNGVFLRVPSQRKIRLRSGDLLRLGRQFLMLEGGADGPHLLHFDAQGRDRGRHALPEGSLVVGRDAQLDLDADDGTLSRRHLAISRDGSVVRVKDLLSANGSFVQVRGSRRLKPGDRFQVGRQRFVYSDRVDPILDSGPAPAPAGKPEVEAVEPDSSTDAPMVTFQPSGLRCPVVPGQTLLELAESNGLAVRAECRAGICGSDPVRILSGAEFLSALPDDGECETLEDLCDLEPGPCRLACRARVTGSMTVEILDG